jgi:ABC-type sugar transport system ATPase subunit
VEQYFPTHVTSAPGEERLRVEGLCRAGSFSDVSFTVREGEVVGLAGLVGAGRSEIARTIFGLTPATRGTIRVHGEAVSIRSVHDALRLRIGLVPEDRKKQGLVLCMKSGENCTLPSLPTFARFGWIDRLKERAAVREMFTRLHVRVTEDAVTASLSGGNQQKLVMAKWLTKQCDILILDEPTRGVDVGTKAELHAWIDEQVANGCAVLLISSELPELIALSSRIIVLRNGRVTGELSRAEATQDGLLRLMIGLDVATGTR